LDDLSGVPLRLIEENHHSPPTAEFNGTHGRKGHDILKITRKFTTAGTDVFSTVEWTLRTS
jgi:hypothetical protein